jgi:hypothetical protein
MLGLLILIVSILGLLSRFGKQKLALLTHNNLLWFARRPSEHVDITTTNELTSNHQIARVSYESDLAASIHTVGERRFYVLPENQIRVFEAPPTYSDALKHPSVSSYTNGGFADIDTEVRFDYRIRLD